MPADLNLTSIIISAVATFLVTAAAGVVLYERQKERRIIEYRILQMPLVRFKPRPDRALNVRVRKSAITNNEADAGSYEEVDTAYGFEITARNVGNRPADNPVITITLDESAHILEYETQPPASKEYDVLLKPEYEIPIGKPANKTPNVLRVVPPYLNDKESIRVRVVSMGNTTAKCDVKIGGRYIKGRPQRVFSSEILVPIVLLLAASIFTFVSEALPDQAKLTLGGVPETVKKVADPGWYFWVVIVLLGLGLIFATGRLATILIRSGRRYDEKGALSWDLPETEPGWLEAIRRALR